MLATQTPSSTSFSRSCSLLAPLVLAALALGLLTDTSTAAAPPRPVASAARVHFAHGATARPARGGGVVLQWRTSQERASAGFRVLRAHKGRSKRRVQVPAGRLVAGSAVRLGATRTLTASTRYRRWDPAGRRGDRYWITDVDVSGRQTVHGPFVVRGLKVARGRSSALLPRKATPGQTPGAKTPVKEPTLGDPVPLAPIAPTVALGTPPEEVQQNIASRQTVRLGVSRTGWLRVSLALIENRGVDVSVPANLHVFADGREVAALVRDGGLEFPGVAESTEETTTRAYFIDAETGRGLRVATAPAAADAPDGPTSWTTATPPTARPNYFSGVANGTNTNFFGLPLTSSASSLIVTAEGLAGAAGAQLSVSVQGVTTAAHEVEVSLNGTQLGTVRWDGLVVGRRTFNDVPVLDGDNRVTLRTTTAADVDLVDQVVLRHQRTLTATGSSLAPILPGGRRVALGGFADPSSVRVVDVTDPAAALVVPAAVRDGGVLATAPGEGARSLQAFTPDGLEAPDSADAALPGTLDQPEHDGALTVITRPDLAPALQPLVDRRRAEGLSVEVVDLQDIYDRFSFGRRDAGAIRRFLDTARDVWRTPPAYVLLGGDGSYDELDRQGKGTAGSIVPIGRVDTAAGESSSDSTLTGTYAVGRLPARTPAAMAALVAKTLRFQDAPPAKSAALASDVSDTGDFGGQADRLQELLPPDWTPTRPDRGRDAKATLLASLSAGPDLVNYSGHGAVTRWRGDWLTAADAAGLGNSAHPSLYVLMTCLNGYFIDPAQTSLSEALLSAPGGAAAVLSSGATLLPAPQEAANRTLLDTLYRSPAPVRLGDAVSAALSPLVDPDVRTTETLLGDPSLPVGR